MKIEINTDIYNERRYGKPYIATIDFSENPKGEANWGDWIGHSGQEGICAIDANAGDIIMQGQKDNRGRWSTPDYYIVQVDGSLKQVGSKPDAYNAWKEAQEQKQEFDLSGVPTEVLLEELNKRGVEV